MIVQRKYFNQITKYEMAARKIQCRYRFYLKNIRVNGRIDRLDSIDLTKYIITRPGYIQCINFNKIKNGAFNKVENYTMEFAQIDNGSLIHIIPILTSTLRQIKICAIGNIIGKVIINFGGQTIVDKIINKKEACFYINAPLPCFSLREINTEHPTIVYGLFCDIDLNIFGAGILFKYCGNFQSMNGIALSHNQYPI